jgi:hypothetical protein
MIIEYEPVGQLVRELIRLKFPDCDLIYINDEYFEHTLLSSDPFLASNTYSFSLDVNDSASYKDEGAFKNKPSGISRCSNILVSCWSFEECDTELNSGLYKILQAKHILKMERHSFVFIPTGNNNNNGHRSGY